MLNFNPQPLLGVPWVWRARPSWPEHPSDGWDCWGLFRWCVQAQTGIVLPDWLAETEGVDPADWRQRWALQEACIRTGLPAFEKVERPRLGDGVMLFMARRPLHCGFCLGNGRFLHVDRNLPTAIDRLDDMRWRDRIEGFYRAGRV